MPDFAQVYSFIGSIFDSNASGHMERLKMMDPINIETVCLIQRLVINLLVSAWKNSGRSLASQVIFTKLYNHFLQQSASQCSFRRAFTQYIPEYSHTV